MCLPMEMRLRPLKPRHRSCRAVGYSAVAECLHSALQVIAMWICVLVPRPATDRDTAMVGQHSGFVDRCEWREAYRHRQLLGAQQHVRRCARPQQPLCKQRLVQTTPGVLSETYEAMGFVDPAFGWDQ